MVGVRVSNEKELSVMEKGAYNDSQLVTHFRGVLVAVTTVSLLTHIRRTIQND